MKIIAGDIPAVNKKLGSSASNPSPLALPVIRMMDALENYEQMRTPNFGGNQFSSNHLVSAYFIINHT